MNNKEIEKDERRGRKKRGGVGRERQNGGDGRGLSPPP